MSDSRIRQAEATLRSHWLEIVEVKKAQGVDPRDFYSVGVVLGRDHVRMPVHVNGEYILDFRVKLDQPDVVLEDRA